MIRRGPELDNGGKPGERGTELSDSGRAGEAPSPVNQERPRARWIRRGPEPGEVTGEVAQPVRGARGVIDVATTGLRTGVDIEGFVAVVYIK